MKKVEGDGSRPEGEQKTLPPRHVVSFAVEVSTSSPCRSKRGVVLFSGDDIVSHGYNYKPRGFDCDGSEACKATCRIEAVHAEQMALMKGGLHVQGCDLLHVKTVDGRLVPSGPPSCVQCSKLALASGISGVWLFHEDGWRRYEGAEFHRLSLASLLTPSSPEQGEAAIAEGVARRAHAGQKEESTGDDYIRHVERVVAMVEGDEAKAVAWLHDVLEDTDYTAAELRRAGISAPVVTAVELLTREDNGSAIVQHTYAQYIDSIKASGNELALAVKLADLRDHLRPNCPERLRPRYERALENLLAAASPSVDGKEKE